MRFRSLALAALLFACADPESGNMANMPESDPAGPADEAISPDGAPSTDPRPGAPAPGQPAPEQPAPEPSGSVTLSAAPARAAAGSTMTLTLRNGSSQPVGYNLCTSGLVSGSGAAVQTDRVCTLELRTLNPAASATYAWELPETVAAGRYRFTTGIDRIETNSRTSVQSNSFEVTAD